MNNQAAIFTTSEKMVVIETDSHSLNWKRMSLNFADSVHLESASGLILSNLIDNNRTGLVRLTNTAEESLTIVSHTNLGSNKASLIWLFLHIGVPNLTIITNTVNLIRSTWDVDNTCHGDIFLSEVLLCVSVGSLLDIE